MKTSRFKLSAALLIAGIFLLFLFFTREPKPHYLQGGGPEKKTRVPALQGSTPERPRVAVADTPVQTDAGNKPITEQEQHERLMHNLAEKLSNPAINQMIAGQQRILMENQFSDLVKTLNLSDEEEDYFLDLLMQRQMLRVDFGMKMMAGMLSPDEKDRLARKLETDTVPIMEELDYFLNHSEDSEYFRYYEQTELQRQAVNTLKDQAARAGSAVEDTTGEALVDLLFKTVSNHTFSEPLESNGQPDLSKLTDQNIETRIQEMTALAPLFLEQATTFLKPNILALSEEAFNRYVEAERNRLLMMKSFFSPTDEASPYPSEDR